MFFLKTRNIGNFGENEAVKYLKKHGYKILERNFAIKSGEIDIIAQKDKYISFVEVKTRSSDRFGEPRDAVNYKKQQKIISVANYYMSNKDSDTCCRFDVIEVVLDKNSNKIIKIEHIEDAFWC